MGRLVRELGTKRIDRMVEKGIAPHPQGSVGLNLYYNERWAKRQQGIEAEKKDVRESYGVADSSSETTTPEQKSERKSLFANLTKRGTLFGN